MIRKLIVQILANLLGIWLVVKFVPGISYSGRWDKLLLAGAMLGFLNFFLKPILKKLTFPFLFITFGLFALVINAFLLWITSIIIPELKLETWNGVAISVLVLTIINIIFGFIFKIRKKRKKAKKAKEEQENDEDNS